MKRIYPLNDVHLSSAPGHELRDVVARRTERVNRRLSTTFHKHVEEPAISFASPSFNVISKICRFMFAHLSHARKFTAYILCK